MGKTSISELQEKLDFMGRDYAKLGNDFRTALSRIEELEGKLEQRDKDIGQEVERNVKLNTDLKEAHKLLFDAGVRSGELQKLTEELRATTDQMRAQGGLIVYALERALELTNLLFADLPAGVPVSPGVVTSKHNLDAAMAAIRRK